MDDRDYGAATEMTKAREVSPVERILNENEKLLAVLNETVADVRSRLKHVSSSRPENDSQTSEPSEPRMGSSAMLDNLYQQQAQIKRATRALREVLETVEV